MDPSLLEGELPGNVEEVDALKLSNIEMKVKIAEFELEKFRNAHRGLAGYIANKYKIGEADHVDPATLKIIRG